MKEERKERKERKEKENKRGLRDLFYIKCFKHLQLKLIKYPALQIKSKL